MWFSLLFWRSEILLFPTTAWILSAQMIDSAQGFISALTLISTSYFFLQIRWRVIKSNCSLSGSGKDRTKTHTSTSRLFRIEVILDGDVVCLCAFTVVVIEQEFVRPMHVLSVWVNGASRFNLYYFSACDLDFVAFLLPPSRWLWFQARPCYHGLRPVQPGGWRPVQHTELRSHRTTASGENSFQHCHLTSHPDYQPLCIIRLCK